MDVVDAIANVATIYIDSNLSDFPYDSNIGTVDIISVYEVPEPTTLLLFLGSLPFVRGKRK